MYNTPKGHALNKNEIIEDFIEYEEYYIIKENNAFKFIIGKINREIIIKCKNYEIKFNNDDLSILTKSIFNNIDDSYKFIIYLFEENKVKIKDISTNKAITILLKVYIYNKEKDIEMILVYNKENKYLIINELNNKYNNLKTEINNLKDEIYILKEEINNLKIPKKQTNNNNSKDNHLINDNIFNSNPNEIKFLKDLAKDSYADCQLDNTFITFKTKDEIFYLVYAKENKSIISYDIINNKKNKEIKNAHEDYIINFQHYYDKINKEDLILSISSDDSNIKLWNINNWDIILNLKNINNCGWIYSACFLNDNDQNYILASNSNSGNCESIKVFDFKGNKIKEINDSNEKTYYINSYFDYRVSKNYIITGNKGYVKSYDFTNNKIYHIYNDNKDNDNNKDHNSIIINDKEDIIKIIESSEDGKIRIWDFHSGSLINKIEILNSRLYGICLWNNKYLFVGNNDKNIKLINLEKGTISKYLIGHNNYVLTLKKIIHPHYGECLISQNYNNGQIKIWAI